MIGRSIMIHTDDTPRAHQRFNLQNRFVLICYTNIYTVVLTFGKDISLKTVVTLKSNTSCSHLCGVDCMRFIESTPALQWGQKFQPKGWNSLLHPKGWGFYVSTTRHNNFFSPIPIIFLFYKAFKVKSKCTPTLHKKYYMYVCSLNKWPQSKWYCDVWVSVACLYLKEKQKKS